MPDYRKSLPQLRSEWANCTRCHLGERRINSGGQFVFGEGYTGGIMFVGEGPGGTEEQYGRPFIGPSGKVLRKAIERLGIVECSYISNIVACRSCGPQYDGQGQMKMRYNRARGVREPIIVDEAPTLSSINACLNRLYEEIYLVDPILIVALGGEAAKALARHSLKVTEKRGTTQPIRVPGAWSVPDRTSAGNWSRKAGGNLIYPTTQHYVEYLMLITIHPAHVLRNQADRSFGNPLQEFMDDMHMAADVYYRFAKEAYGIECSRKVNLVAEDIMEREDQ